MVSTEHQRKKFLLKAKEADDFATRSRNQGIRESWLSIAESYRSLAKALDKIKD